jgi:uncharacterized membrane protein YfcA
MSEVIMIELTLAIIILLVAVATGVLSATVGVGGGFIMVSYMVAVMGYSSQQAVGTSAFVIIFSALSASVAYFRQKRIDYGIGILATFLSVPGAVIGGYATKLIPSQQLAILFSVALFVVGMRMIAFPRERGKDVGPRDRREGPVGDNGKTKKAQSDKNHRWRRSIVDAAGHKFIYESNIIPTIPFFFVAGILSGLFGIGGGIIIVPALEVVAGFPMHLAVATSMFTMIFTSISSASTHFYLGHVVFDYVIFFIIGIIAGAQGGARLAKRMKGSAIERLFGVTMLMIGIYLIIWKGVLGY